MKQVFFRYNLQTTGVVLQVSLKALLRAVGLEVETDSGPIPAEVIDSLRIGVERPGTSGIVPIRQDEGAASRYVIGGDLVTITVGNLPEGNSILLMSGSYGTNTPMQLLAELIVPLGAEEGYDEAKEIDFSIVKTIGGGGSAMHRVELVYDSATNTIQREGEVLTYSQVEALIADAGNFVTLQDGDDTSFLLPHYGDGAAIIFTGLDVFSTGDYSHRIAINSDEEVKREYFPIQRRKEAKVIANDVAEVMLNQDEVVIAEARTADLAVTLPYMAPKGAEFHLFIEVAGTPTITWPAGVTWAGGEVPTLENGKTVEVSFVNNFATSVTYENV